MSIGQKIKKLREEKGLNQYQFSKEINIPQPVVRRIELTECGVNSETIKKICKYFNISADYLLDLKE